MNKFRKYSLLVILITAASLTGCKDDDDDVTPAVTPPPMENEEEVITDVKLIFTNSADANDIVEARAQDPDGEGVQELAILDTIKLDVSKTYVLTYEILNALDANDVENIGDEIKEEDDEHQIFYSFSNNAFANPTGNGNIDNAADAVNYNDEDSEAQDGSGNPVGLSTTWTTSATQLNGGNFTVRLQHQPDVKTSSSVSNDGDTDFELPFVLSIQ